MSVGAFGTCCADCQVYWTCETKWYRGERHEDFICCDICNYYNECKRSTTKKAKSLKKK